MQELTQLKLELRQRQSRRYKAELKNAMFEKDGEREGLFMCLTHCPVEIIHVF